VSEQSHALNYMNYLAVDELLSLQRPVSEGPEHDELLFITIHQVYELWFKQLLHELEQAQRQMDIGDTQDVLATLNRVKAILSVCIQQIDVLITMTPLQFGAFRSRLESASGFQSAQFRELEALLGRRDGRFASHLLPQHREKVEARMQAPSLWDSALGYLNGSGFTIPAEILERDVTENYVSDARVREAVLEAYRSGHQAGLVCEQLVDIEVSLREWRFRHVMMVERTIGTKQGTGGSSGVGYLSATLQQPHSFPELWEAREGF
jgi:tryptophan 2,3-dioxygenase